MSILEMIEEGELPRFRWWLLYILVGWFGFSLIASLGVELAAAFDKELGDPFPLLHWPLYLLKFMGT